MFVLFSNKGGYILNQNSTSDLRRRHSHSGANKDLTWFKAKMGERFELKFKEEEADFIGTQINQTGEGQDTNLSDKND